MFSRFYFVTRLVLAWLAVYITAALTFAQTFLRNSSDTVGGYAVLGGFALSGAVISTAISHAGRVALVADGVDAGKLANRHRRQIEMPLDANEAFALVDAVVRELPGAHDVASTPDSLQVRAKVLHVNPYQTASAKDGKERTRVKRNQVLAIITPNGDACSVKLVCEPERPTWTDLFLVDGGTNLENAEAITRALSRRVAERRRSEQATVQQTVTEKELTQARLSLLHAQVEPHFLYNTLASAQLLTRSDPPRADVMLGNLIAYLRHSLPRTDESLSTLGIELERARAYLDILKIRMGGRLNFQVDVADELLAVELPPMMLQTLVENAIKHGLEPKSGGGTVWILARAFDHSVSVTVADDGRGFSAEGGGTGIGLRNVRERLRLAYGAAASFAIVANFPSGVAATLTVPNSTLGGSA